MDHFGGNLHRGFTGDEDDSPPVAALHAGEILSAQTDAAHNIDFKEAKPIFIRNLIEGLGLKNRKVVDENIHVGKTLNGRANSVSAPEGGSESFPIFPRLIFTN